MAEIIQFPRHRLYGRDVPCGCNLRSKHPGYYCSICEGGLALCAACNGAEGSLPTDCPGVEMEDVVEESVFAQVIDYDARLGWVQRSAIDEYRRRMRK